jgi:phage terminase large subunit
MTQATIPKPSRAAAGSLLRDPVLFARKVLGADLWKTQRDILAAVAQHSRVAAKSCHSSGKTYAIAIAVLWWLTAHRDGIVVTTAPTWLQVEKIIWGEIKNAVRRSSMRGIIKFPMPTSTELRLGSQNYAIGLSTDDSSRFQGFHSGHVLVVLDEAPGVRAEVYEAVEGIRAGGQVHVLALGNPTVSSGPFYDAFTTTRASWRTLTINAFDTPNLEGLPLEDLRLLPKGLSENYPTFKYRPRPYLVTRRWVYEKLWEWGEESPLWQSRVLGSFPEQAEDSLISLKWLEAARDPIEVPAHHRVTVGIDVAGSDGGDETVVAVQAAGNILALGAWSLRDPLTKVNEFLLPYKPRIEEVNVDVIGVGHNFVPRLEALGYACNEVNVGTTTRFPDQFANLKAQLYWKLRELFQDGAIHGLNDELAISQLASIKWKANLRGLTQIESKDDLKKRGIGSPDRAEAIMLAFADRTPNILQYVRQRVKYDQALEKAQAEGKPAPQDWDQGWDPDELSNAYDQIAREVEWGSEQLCPKCGQPLGATKTMNSDGKYYHPECVRPC